MPAKAVKPFVSGNKNDAYDARAIWTAAQMPGINPVAVKSEEQQVLFRRLSEGGFAGLFRVLMARISRNERSLPVRGKGSGCRPAECIHGRAFGFFGGLGTGHGPIARRIVVAGF